MATSDTREVVIEASPARELSAEGPDAEDAVASLIELVDGGFGEY